MTQYFIMVLLIMITVLEIEEKIKNIKDGSIKQGLLAILSTASDSFLLANALKKYIQESGDLRQECTYCLYRDEDRSDDEIIEASKLMDIVKIVADFYSQEGVREYYATLMPKLSHSLEPHNVRPFELGDFFTLRKQDQYKNSNGRHTNYKSTDVCQSLTSVLAKNLSFFKKLEKEYLQENRHADANLQHEYDKQFGLVIKQ